jgi:hypothetical protein
MDSHVKARPLPKNASAAKRAAQAKNEAALAEHEAYVVDYLGRYFKQGPDGGSWTRPRRLRSLEAIVELAVAGLDHVAPSRALCVAVCRAAGIRMR